MIKFYFILFLLFCQIICAAQLNATSSIPGSDASVSKVVLDSNTVDVNGNLIFTIAVNASEQSFIAIN